MTIFFGPNVLTTECNTCWIISQHHMRSIYPKSPVSTKAKATGQNAPTPLRITLTIYLYIRCMKFIARILIYSDMTQMTPAIKCHWATLIWTGYTQNCAARLPTDRRRQTIRRPAFQGVVRYGGSPRPRRCSPFYNWSPNRDRWPNHKGIQPRIDPLRPLCQWQQSYQQAHPRVGHCEWR